MTNICRCGTYQRIRAAVHMAAESARPPQRTRKPKPDARESGHERRPRSKADESFAPPVHRRLRRRGRRAGARLALPFGARRRRRAQTAARRRRGQRLGGDQAGRHLRDPHRPLGDGTGHADGPRPARRRGARVRLEEGRRPSSPTPGQNLARKRVWGEMGTGGSRGIRTSQDYVRRGGAAARDDAAAGRGRRVEGAGRRAHGVRTASSRTRRPKRKTSYGKVAAPRQSCTPPDPKRIKLKDPKDWKIAGKPMKRLDTADKLNGSLVYAIDVKLPGMLNAAIKACPVFGGKLVSFDEAKIAGMPGVRAGRQGRTTRRSPSSPIPGGARRRRSMRCRSSGTKAPSATQSSATIAEHLKEGLTAPRRLRDAAGRRRAEGDRRRGEEGRGGLHARRSSPTRRWSR